MQQLCVISGKGGTGKTTITAGFSWLADKAVLADCDVDAADLHILLDPSVQRTEEFSGGKTARLQKDLCTQCGACCSGEPGYVWVNEGEIAAMAVEMGLEVDACVRGFLGLGGGGESLIA